MSDALEIGGLRDLQRTFRELEPALAKALRAELKDVGEPVRAAAQVDALRDITNIGPVWSLMRIGTSPSKGIYVAPKSRNKGGSKRPNLAGLLEKAMDDAVEEKAPEVFARMELTVNRLIERYD